MGLNLLVLGGTTEATALARRLADSGVTATLSLAGRVARPAPQPLPTRIGGFGGVAGLADFLRQNAITHLVDATHPFAAQMSRNAVAAATQCGVKLIALTRPPWRAEASDTWHRVPDIAAAVAALAGPPQRVFLAVGRMHLAAFAAQPQHHYLLRLVDPPDEPLPLPQTQVVVDRGPFTQTGDRALMQAHGTQLVVSKNSGGSGAVAKLAAARGLGLPVLMIDRPALPDRPERHDVGAVMDWLDHGATERGV